MRTQIFLHRPAAYMLHEDTSSSSIPPTQSTWTCFLPACYPCNLRGISTGDTYILFTLGTRCISYYFCSGVRVLSRLPPTQFMQHVKGGLQVNIQHLPSSLSSLLLSASFFIPSYFSSSFPINLLLFFFLSSSVSLKFYIILTD